jgi:hypothetical protein
MCIAIWKPEGSDLLPKATYEQCWNLNRDGGSISYWNKEEKHWNVVKGLMEWEDWLKVFNEMKTDGRIGKDVGVFAHFRVGTAGKNFEAALTHPFPISDQLADLQHTMFAARDIIAHNGTIGAGNKNGTASDTMLAVLDYFEPLWDLVYYKNGQVRNKKLENILQECLDTANSRWFIANGPEVTLYGPWIHDKEYDTHFSNDDYDDPYHGWGGAGAYVDEPWWSSSHRQFTARYIRQGKMDVYLTQDGDWDWDAWKSLNGFNDKAKAFGYDDDDRTLPERNTILTDDDDLTPEHDRDNGLVLAVVDEDGTLHWEDSYYDDDDDDMLCCPDCASDDIIEYEGLNIADYACHICGCLFDSKTGEVLAYDQQIPEMIVGECMYCDREVLIEETGNCHQCGAILDIKEATNDS